ncbi:transposase InsO family protein [Bradyrhizobium sp. GM6.1]
MRTVRPWPSENRRVTKLSSEHVADRDGRDQAVFIAAAERLVEEEVAGFLEASERAHLVGAALQAAFCVETQDALARHGKPDIFNTDQGSQFTGAAFTGVLASHGIAISMDGQGSWRDNVYVKRLWRSVKYEEVYLRACDTVSDARASIGRYLDFYNGRRPHSSLDGGTPDQAYFNPLPFRAAA